MSCQKMIDDTQEGGEVYTCVYLHVNMRWEEGILYFCSRKLSENTRHKVKLKAII